MTPATPAGVERLTAAAPSPSSDALVLDANAPRLAPIDRAPGLLLRLFHWMFRVRFGKPMMAARVIYTRLPRLLWRQLPLYALLQSGLGLDATLRQLIQLRVSNANGCTFCADLHRADATLARVTRGKLAAVDDYAHSELFDARERVALRYVSEIAQTGRASDATFEALRACFDERAIVEITWLQAFTTYLNRMAVPLGIGSDGFCALVDAKAARH